MDFPVELFYLEEIQLLKNLGLISDWWQYDQLPVSVIEDAHLLLEAQFLQRQAASHG